MMALTTSWVLKKRTPDKTQEQVCRPELVKANETLGKMQKQKSRAGCKKSSSMPLPHSRTKGVCRPVFFWRRSTRHSQLQVIGGLRKANKELDSLKPAVGYSTEKKKKRNNNGQLLDETSLKGRMSNIAAAGSRAATATYQ